METTLAALESIDIQISRQLDKQNENRFSRQGSDKCVFEKKLSMKKASLKIWAPLDSSDGHEPPRPSPSDVTAK